MNIKQLKKLIKDLPDEMLVEVNIISEGTYYDADVGAIVWSDRPYTNNRVLIITVGDDE